MDFTKAELELLIEALNKTATRHESEARFNPRAARPHDDKAIAMRKLRNRLLPKVAAAALVLLAVVSTTSAWAECAYWINQCSGGTCRQVCVPPACSQMDRSLGKC